MGHLRNHRRRWLVVVLGLGLSANASASSAGCGFTSFSIFVEAPYTGPNQTHNPPFQDEGQAFQACNTQAKGREPFAGEFGGMLYPRNPGTCRIDESAKAVDYVVPSAVRERIQRSDCAGMGVNDQGPETVFRRWTYSTSCATRPNGQWEWFGGTDFLACKDGCQYSSVTPTWSSAPSCAWTFDAFGNRIYRCQGEAAPTGDVCSGTWDVTSGDPPAPPAEPPPNPEQPPPNPEQPPPNPEQPPPNPEEPPPPPPDDGNDDGQQVSETLGPKLDAIEQAVLGLGPKIDGVKQSVDGARADANTDADRIVDALGQVRNAIGSNAGGDGEGEGDGPPDLSPLTPGDHGGEHPGRSQIVEEGSVADLIGGLDQDGFGLARSCPAYTWQMSFDLGWTDFDLSPAVDFICTALQVFAYMIALAGLIQAAYILGRVGAT